MKSYIERLRLKFTDPQMEAEYDLFKRQTNLENYQMTVYFIVFFFIIPGIPSLISEDYTDFGITIGVIALLVVIHCWKKIPNKISQCLVFLIVMSFNLCFFYLDSTTYHNTPRTVMFFRGYGFASINIIMIVRLPEFRQKILMLAIAFAMRFSILLSFDPDSFDPFVLTRHILIDLFVVYFSYSNEKKERTVFKRFVQHREELGKFKELLADHFPQSVSIVNNNATKTLFTNKAYDDLFGDHEILKCEDNSPIAQPSLTDQPSRPRLSFVRVDKENKGDMDAMTMGNNYSENASYLKKLVTELLGDKLDEHKTLCVSAYYQFQTDTKYFEVKLAKVKWGSEDAAAIILNDSPTSGYIAATRAANNNKDKVIAIVSHELRTPLAGIIGILELAEKRIDDCEALEYLNLCKDNAHLLLSLANSLLDFHQIDQGKINLNLKRVDIRRVLTAVSRLFQYQCKEKGIYLKLEVDEDIPNFISSDENRLKQVLINLLGNALKFTSQGGITIKVSQDNESVEYLDFCVSDTGIGIKEEDLARLFTMYGKLEDKENMNSNGVGLGLMISSVLASILKGKKNERGITVTSKVGEGSQFRFKVLKNLKLEKEKSLLRGRKGESKGEEKEIMEEYVDMDLNECLDEASGLQTKMVKHVNISKNFEEKKKDFSGLSRSIEDESTKHDKLSAFERNTNELHSMTSMYQGRERSTLYSMPSQKKEKILVVDDNPFNLLVAKNIVEEAGYIFKKAQSGQAAIDEMIRLHQKGDNVTAILMDCQMPVMDGYETTEALIELMEQNKIGRTPIIALTANNNQEDLTRCYKSGMVDNLMKPLSARGLLDSLSKVRR